MSLFFLHSDHNCCPFPRFSSLSLSRSSFVPSLLLLDVAGRGGWGVGGVTDEVEKKINKARKREINERKVTPKGNCVFTVFTSVHGPMHVYVPIPVLCLSVWQEK